MILKRICSILIISLLAFAGLSNVVHTSASASDPIPYQYIAKVYTEGLGRAPDQSGWASSASYFASNGCNAASLEYLGKSALESVEFTGLGYSNPALVLVGYRTVLNREVDSSGYPASVAELNNGSVTWDGFLNQLYGSSEFTGLISAICSATTPDYHFGTAPATDVDAGASGFSGTQSQLQSLLNSTASGATVALAQRVVIRLTSTLIVPAGVTLTTYGSPDPRHYANQGRLVRANVWPTFSGAAVQLTAGAKLSYLWVDGQMGIPSRYNAGAVNVRVLSGTNSGVTYSRLGNSAGNTALSVIGGGDPQPGTGLFINCVTNNYSYNLVEAYSSDHYNGHWSDGLSIGCENSTVAANQVVDASDVGVIFFGEAGRTQNSMVSGNTVVNAGHGAYGSLGIDPWLNPSGGDGAGVATRDFTGAIMQNNTFWNSDRAPNAIGIAIGTRAWTAGQGYNGHNAVIQSNSTGSGGLWAGDGIVVSGMLNGTVSANSISLTIVTGQSNCTTAAVGAAVTAGYASGTIQGPYTDANYFGCIVGLTR